MISLVNILICLFLSSANLQNKGEVNLPLPIDPINDTIPASKLIEDTWSLAKTLEDVHPEPYIETKGRIGFYRKIHDIISLIPEEGMTSGDYYFIARKIVSLTPDSHTWINDPVIETNISPGLPLICSYLQGDLIILALYDKQYESIIGSKLLEVEGVSIDVLLERIAEEMNSENRVQAAHLLCGTYGFLSSRHLTRILPEWINRGKIDVFIEEPGGNKKRLELIVPESYGGLNLVYHPSPYRLPGTDRCDFAWSFAGSDSSTALLVVKGTMDFRENFEIWRELEIENNMQRAYAAYRRYNEKAPSEDLNEVISGLPSASDFIREMVVRLKEKDVSTLIVDLRGNEGGTSFFADILLYYLYGKEELFRIKADYSMITRFSDYYFKYAPGTELDDLNRLTGFIHRKNDYDFSREYNYTSVPDYSGQQKYEFEKWVAMMKSFAIEYESGTYEKYFKPDNIFIITSTETYSAGLTFAVQFSKAGAKIAGSASRQSPNSFGDILVYRLPYSGLSCNISHKKFEYFPGDPLKGKTLEPDVPLTYEKFMEYGFDLNAELLIVLGLISE